MKIQDLFTMKISKKFKKHPAFSLVELIITITIVGILAGLFVPNVLKSYSTEAPRTAEKVKAFLTLCQNYSLSRPNEVYFMLTKDADDKLLGIYYEEQGGVLVEISREVLGSKNIKIDFEDVYISFAQRTGRLDTFYTSLFFNEDEAKKSVNSDEYTLAFSSFGKSATLKIIAPTGYILIGTN